MTPAQPRQTMGALRMQEAERQPSSGHNRPPEYEARVRRAAKAYYRTVTNFSRAEKKAMIESMVSDHMREGRDPAELEDEVANIRAHAFAGFGLFALLGGVVVLVIAAFA